MTQTMPTINVVFRQLASTAVARSQKGTVALILCDASASENDQTYQLRSTAQIPESLGAENQAAIRRVFQGGAKTVLVYVQNAGVTITGSSPALKWLATRTFDYLALHGGAVSSETKAVKEWIIQQRTDNHAIYKAVLPDTVADHEAIINFTASDIQVDEDTFTAADYCGRVAGILAGLPMKQSATYVPLAEVDDIKRLTALEMDTAVGKGQLILFHDGKKVKFGRAVNSLTTTTGKSAQWQKIKILEMLDMIGLDIRTAIADNYIGKVPNTYANKQLLISAIIDYLSGLERDQLIEPGFEVNIALEDQRAWLESQGIPTADMSEDEIRQANTGTHVYLYINITPVDAMEDVDVGVYLPITV